ncbi:helix-turn-helix domain-containing protein [Xylocopilactobacillus apicola]|uniref:AraC family transcriptional regulator n=1 Tax=Xylocopilactobacillus apicola TaxID=2932184 RepID=A0AAU9DP88_9LACO|nr:helix-turn-helix domain-containing protein [Xylocopilactobacillus apicola]BDR58947.1 AraC family transcriptional regulator [Xylocopilactobacillus apicola]
MESDILSLLKKKSRPRMWEKLAPTMEPDQAGVFDHQPVYEFFYSLTDSLEINTHTIGISVYPVESYVPYHIHNYVEIIIPLIGECDVLTKNEEIHVTQNNIVIIGNHATHAPKRIPEGCVVVNIALKESAFSLNDFNFIQQSISNQSISNLLFALLSNEDLGENTYALFQTDHNQQIINTFYDIIYEYYHPDIQTNQIIRLEIRTLFSRLIRAASKESSNIKVNNQISNNRLLTLLLYIEKNYLNITLDKMAKHFGFNPNYLSNYFKEKTGLSFIQLVHLQRVNIAAEYLTYTSASIEQISSKIGYENPSYFYKIFKKYMLISPNEYRKNNRLKQKR